MLHTLLRYNCPRPVNAETNEKLTPNVRCIVFYADMQIIFYVLAVLYAVFIGTTVLYRLTGNIFE